MRINKPLQFFGRLITAIIVLGITAFFTPGFEISKVWILASAIVILVLIDFFIDCFTKIFYHPYIKLILGFILASISLFLVQYIIIGYALSYISIILGALVYGLVDYILPSEEYMLIEKNQRE